MAESLPPLRRQAPDASPAGGRQRGSVARTVVGPPGLLSMEKIPPSIRTRSPIPTTPMRPLSLADSSELATSKPLPLSKTRTAIARSSTVTVTVADVAQLCSRTFVSASCTVRKMVIR